MPAKKKSGIGAAGGRLFCWPRMRTAALAAAFIVLLAPDALANKPRARRPWLLFPIHVRRFDHVSSRFRMRRLAGHPPLPPGRALVAPSGPGGGGGGPGVGRGGGGGQHRPLDRTAPPLQSARRGRPGARPAAVALHAGRDPSSIAPHGAGPMTRLRRYWPHAAALSVGASAAVVAAGAAAPLGVAGGGRGPEGAGPFPPRPRAGPPRTPRMAPPAPR